MIFTAATVAVVGAALLGSTITQSSLSSLDTDAQIIESIHAMGGLQLVMPKAFAETSCDSLEMTGRPVHDFKLIGVTVDLPVMGGKTYSAMTFNYQVPGPTLRVTQGDVIKATLEIPDTELTAHGVDMHSSQITSDIFGPAYPGDSITYCYIAESAGIFKYHCTGIELAAMDQHVFSGMYGIVIVDPLDGYNKLLVEKTKVVNGDVELDRKVYGSDALEFQMQYSQLYLTDAGTYDMTKMLRHENTATTVNGMQYGYVPNHLHNLLVNGDENRNIFVVQPWNDLDLKQYQSQLLFVETDQPVRLFLANHANAPVFFHIVGEILDRVTQGNRIQSAATETWMLGGSQNMIVDLVFDEPGVYAAVNHDYAAIYSGAASIFVAGDPFDLNPRLIEAGILTEAVPSYAYVLGNPSDAVPPEGVNSMSHPAVNVHGLYTDEVAQMMMDDGAISLWDVVPTLPPIP